MRDQHTGRTSDPANAIDVHSVIQLTVLYVGLSDDIKGTQTWHVRPLVRYRLPGFAPVLRTVQRNGVRHVGKITRAYRSCKSVQTVYESNATKKSALLFPLLFPCLSAIAGVVNTTVAIDIPAFTRIDKGNIVLFARIRVRFQFSPALFLWIQPGLGRQQFVAPAHRRKPYLLVIRIKQLLNLSIHKFIIGLLHGARLGKKMIRCGISQQGRVAGMKVVDRIDNLLVISSGESLKIGFTKLHQHFGRSIFPVFEVRKILNLPPVFCIPTIYFPVAVVLPGYAQDTVCPRIFGDVLQFFFAHKITIVEIVLIDYRLLNFYGIHPGQRILNAKHFKLILKP